MLLCFLWKAIKTVTVDSDNYVTRDTYGLLPPASCGKVMFLHLSVILPTGGVSASVHAGIDTPLDRHPRADTPPSRRLLQRMVRILLECILVIAYVQPSGSVLGLIPHRSVVCFLFDTNSPQYRNVNIANFVLGLSELDQRDGNLSTYS